MGRRMLSALAVVAVTGVAAAAIFDSVRGEPLTASPPTKPPPCREGQLALQLVASDDPVVVVLRHVRGPRCTAPEYDVVVEVPRGQLLVRGGWIDWRHCPSGCAIDTVGGLFGPGVQEERTFRFQPRCDQRGPFSAAVRVGPYSARATIPAVPCLRTATEVAAFHRECVRRWNAANPANRALVAAGGYNIGVLFRSSDATEVERCGLQFVSSQTARWLLAFRVADRWWSIERVGVGDPPSASDFYDTRQVQIRPDGTILLRDD